MYTSTHILYHSMYYIRGRSADAVRRATPWRGTQIQGRITKLPAAPELESI